MQGITFHHICCVIVFEVGSAVLTLKIQVPQYVKTGRVIMYTILSGMKPRKFVSLYLYLPVLLVYAFMFLYCLL